MAYASFDGLAVIFAHGPRFDAAATAALKVGELCNHLFAQADASAGVGTAHYVALEDMASGDVGSFAEWAVLRKPSTIAAGGVVTAGSHGGTLGDMLWLSTTAGDAVEVIDGDGIYQVVGKVISTQDVLLKPSFATGDFFESCEKVTSAETIAIGDSGIAMVLTGTTAIIETLPATAVHGIWIVVNGSQGGDKLTSVSPVAGDGIAGFGFTNTDAGDATNTKATSKAGDYIKILGSGLTGGVMAIELRGVWAGA
jgi:hypothetical protein